MGARGYREKLRLNPQRIPARDLDLLRYWINHATQVMEEGIGIAVQVLDAEENPVHDAFEHLVGNFNHSTWQNVSDQIDLKTDEEGKAHLSFLKFSVVSSFWSVAAERKGLKTEYQTIIIKSGEVSEIDLRLLQ